jgi:hypothetical protein
MKMKTSVTSLFATSLRWVVLVVVALVTPLAFPDAQESKKARPLTAAQKEQLKERRQLIDQASAADRRGQTAEAIAAS